MFSARELEDIEKALKEKKRLLKTMKDELGLISPYNQAFRPRFSPSAASESSLPQYTPEQVPLSELSSRKQLRDSMKLTDLDKLSECFKNLFVNKNSCDVILQVNGKEFLAHKTILIARSPVFAAMFHHDSLEKQTGIINIPDCDPNSFDKFLEFLYCGILEGHSFCDVMHLYSTSNKYDVQELKSFCVKYLELNLEIDTLCDIVQLADRYDEEKLLSAAQIFFNDNVEEVVETAEWENLMKSDYRLANKLIKGMAKSKGSKPKIEVKCSSCKKTLKEKKVKFLDDLKLK